MTLIERVARLEAKDEGRVRLADEIHNDLRRTAVRLAAIAERHDGRLDSLERNQARVLAVVGALVVLANIIGPILAPIVGKIIGVEVAP